MTALAGCLSLAGGLAVAIAVPGSAQAGQKTRPETSTAHAIQEAGTGCHLGHGIKHVIEITFDNVHFFRDNPNVPSDLEMMPNLLHFLEGNGTLLSNNHTPLIAHTADDILTTSTGLYPDRQGMGVANDYQTYNKDGSTDPASSFAYWTDPIYDTASKPNPGHDTNPNMVYSATPPATTYPKPKPDTITPAPWVPFTRAGCDVGDVAYVNQELENTAFDIPKVFGADSPEAKQLAADKDPYKDAETADYEGISVHCAQGGAQGAVCAHAKAVKFHETKPTHTAVPDLLPGEPGGYTGYQALFGHRYVAPQLGAGTPGLTRNGYAITNAAGNLVDLYGNQLNGAYLNNYPGFPGYDSINAAQSLAYVADMQESGVPVTYAYMADLHGNEDIPALSRQCAGAPAALGSGSACYVAQAEYYNKAFGIFFKRLAADGITRQNSLFIVSSDEGDHEAGANVGRAVQPTPASCDGAKVTGDTVKPDVLCTYPSGDFGELDGDMTGLLATQTKNTTPFSLEDDTAPEFYVTGQPGPYTPQVRSLEHAVASLTADNPYAGATQPIANYIADPTEEAILHMVDADPARTPTFALFAKPDYFLETGSATCGTSCVKMDDGYAWDHGDYAAEIDTNYVGFVGPGVKHLGLDGSPPNEGPNSAGPDSGQETVPEENTKGPWVDETDIRPTLMYLAGLKDDYEHDGRVITQILTAPNAALSPPDVTALGECYKQLNSSVGEFGTDTLEAATKAVEGTSKGDAVYKDTDKALAGLEAVRDALAEQVKGELEAAAFHDTPITTQQAQDQTFVCQLVIEAAAQLDS
ncbi:MAG: hypothetical protein ACRDNF_12005 [Streptosporangiaceae bacterium]